jgi:hypothetical protein
MTNDMKECGRRWRNTSSMNESGTSVKISDQGVEESEVSFWFGQGDDDELDIMEIFIMNLNRIFN